MSKVLHKSGEAKEVTDYGGQADGNFLPAPPRSRCCAPKAKRSQLRREREAQRILISPVSSSTPNWRSPARKRPLVTTSPLRGTVNRLRHARKSLSFTTHPVQQPSPQVNVVRYKSSSWTFSRERSIIMSCR